VSDTSNSGETVIIRKYANRRLYNTASSSYVTLDSLAEMVKNGVEFIVQDAKTGEDITRGVLAQIIFEEESKGQNLLPVSVLRQLIGFYGDQVQALVPGWLEVSMKTFAQSQDKMREQMSRAFGSSTPMAAFEEQARQNAEMFQNAMRMWSPFVPGMTGTKAGETSVEPAPPSREEAETLATLQAQLAAMQKQIDALAKK
jgi:polyhydroxyalkanoate synthesis repressor PhaR